MTLAEERDGVDHDEAIKRAEAIFGGLRGDTGLPEVPFRTEGEAGGMVTIHVPNEDHQGRGPEDQQRLASLFPHAARVLAGA